MATHSSVLAWRILGTGEPGGLPSTGSHRVGHVAEILNISQSTYSRYESGYLDVPSEVLIALSSFYGVSVDYILGLTDKNEK